MLGVSPLTLVVATDGEAALVVGTSTLVLVDLAVDDRGSDGLGSSNTTLLVGSPSTIIVVMVLGTALVAGPNTPVLVISPLTIVIVMDRGAVLVVGTCTAVLVVSP